MTMFLVLTALIVLAEVAAGIRFLRHDRPLARPLSHPDWNAAELPSRPYSTRL